MDEREKLLFHVSRAERERIWTKAETITLPAAWAEYYPSIRMWDEGVYAGRRLSFGLGTLPFEWLPRVDQQIINDLRFIENIEVR